MSTLLVGIDPLLTALNTRGLRSGLCAVLVAPLVFVGVDLERRRRPSTNTRSNNIRRRRRSITGPWLSRRDNPALGDPGLNTGGRGVISSVACSHNGSRIISGSWDKTIRVWDASTGIEMLPPLRDHGDWVTSIAFSPDGSKIISGSEDRTIRIWDTIPPLRGHDDSIHSVAFSPDGSKIISGSNDKTIRVWDASTGIVLPTDNSLGRKPTIGAWFTNIDTGNCMGALPVGAYFHSVKLRASPLVGWTREYKPVLIHFPEQ